MSTASDLLKPAPVEEKLLSVAETTASRSRSIVEQTPVVHVVDPLITSKPHQQSTEEQKGTSLLSEEDASIIAFRKKSWNNLHAEIEALWIVVREEEGKDSRNAPRSKAALDGLYARLFANQREVAARYIHAMQRHRDWPVLEICLKKRLQKDGWFSWTEPEEKKRWWYEVGNVAIWGSILDVFIRL